MHSPKRIDLSTYPHHAAVVAYYNEAKTNPEPWLNWEYRSTDGYFWRPCYAEPCWLKTHLYRQKKSTTSSPVQAQPVPTP